MSDFKVNTDMFGKYAIIPTDYSRDEHIYKIVSVFESNAWCEVPILYNSEPVRHKEMQTVLNVIHCGLDETKVVRVALKDCKIRQPQTQADRIRSMSDEELANLITGGELYAICPLCKYYGTNDCYIEHERMPKNCDKGIMDWLQSEVEG